MEVIIKFWPIAAVLGWLLLIWIGVGFYVCRKYTGTWNGLRYIFDHRYWCFAIMNHEYSESLKNKDDIETFIKDFSIRKLMPRRKFGFIKLSKEERKLWAMLLSQQDFIQQNFGAKPYSNARHKEVCRNWDEHLKQRPYGED